MIVLVLGIISVAAGVSIISQGGISFSVEVGAGLIAGAVAYRSLRKRIYNEKEKTIWRIILEFVCIAILGIIILIGFSTNLVVKEPVPYLVIPIIAIGAYFVTSAVSNKKTK